MSMDYFGDSKEMEDYFRYFSFQQRDNYILSLFNKKYIK